MTITEKRCPGCEQTKPVSDFDRRKASRDGLQSQCRPCRAEARALRKTKTNQTIKEKRPNVSIQRTKTGQGSGRLIKYRGQVLAEPDEPFHVGYGLTLLPLEPGQKKRTRSYA